MNQVMRLFPDDNPEQTVRQITFKIAPGGVYVAVKTDDDKDDNPKHAEYKAFIRGAHKIREIEGVLSVLLKILRGNFNMGIQIDFEGSLFRLNERFLKQEKNGSS